MVDLIAIQAAIGGLKAAGDIAKSAIGLRDGAVLQGKVIELNQIILSAQSSAIDAKTEQSALLEHIRELEKQIAQFEAWEAEKQRYKLTDFGGRTFAYELKPGMEDGEPPHRICARCYQQGHKSILQFKFRTVLQQDRHECPGCKTIFDLGEPVPPPARKRRVSHGGSWMSS